MMSTVFDTAANILSFIFAFLAVLSLFRYAVFERIYGDFSLNPSWIKLGLSLFSFISGTLFLVWLYSFGFHLLSSFCFITYCVFCYLIVKVCLVLVELRMVDVYLWYDTAPDRHFRVWLEKRCWVFEQPGLYMSYEEWCSLEE